VSAAPAWALWLHRLNHRLSTELFGGPRLLKLAWVINAQKLGSLPFVLALMWGYGVWTPVAWVYLGLYGSYGVCWFLKDMAFPDANWQRRVTWGGAGVAFLLGLAPYWVLPWLLVSGRGHPPASSAILAFAIGLHTTGLFLMVAADAQKTFTLRHHAGLITDGMFRYVRHPNYLGEMMLYAAYAVLVGLWLGWAILVAIWVLEFVPNMLAKEASLSRYPGYAAYRDRTGALIPRIRS
jgi:protein-S-isoprenylcysteine O-methyltransferase Ste14